MAISPVTVNKAGMDSEAPKVSRARTAYPSMVARAKWGRSSGEDISSASTRCRAFSNGQGFPAQGREHFQHFKDFFRGFYLKKGFHGPLSFLSNGKPALSG